RFTLRGSMKWVLMGLGGSNPEPRGVGVAEFEPETRAGAIRRKESLARPRSAVEEHRFDALVVVEPFEVHGAARRAAKRDVERRRAVAGERNAECIRDGRGVHEARHAAAARR